MTSLKSAPSITCARCYQPQPRHATRCGACGGDARLQQGRYALLSPLGEGASGHTWRAIDAAKDVEVAIKELSFRRLPDFKALELFEREVQTLRQLQHPGVPAWLDHFQVDEPRHIALYLVQELIDGQPLALGGWTEPEVVALLRELAEVLALLARQRPPILHRDIKPDNLMRRADGRFVLIDFGVARQALQRTLDGATLAGTPGYMAPELLSGRVDARADIYSLGATAIALLAGRPAGELLAPDQPGAWRRHLRCSPWLAALLEDMVAPAPARRLPSAEALLARLQAAPTPTAPTPTSPTPAAPAPTRALPDWLVALAADTNRRPALLAQLLLLLAPVVTMGGGLLLGLALLLVWLVTGQPPKRALGLSADDLDRAAMALASAAASAMLLAAAAILLLGGWIERRARGTPPDLLRAARKLRWRAPRQFLRALAAPGAEGIVTRLLGALVVALALGGVGVAGALLGLDAALRAAIESAGAWFRWLILLYFFGVPLLAWALRKAGWLWLGRWDRRARGLLKRDEEGRALLREAAATLPGARAQEAEALSSALRAWGAARALSPRERSQLDAMAAEWIGVRTGSLAALRARLPPLEGLRGEAAAASLTHLAWHVWGLSREEEALQLGAALLAAAQEARRG